MVARDREQNLLQVSAIIRPCRRITRVANTDRKHHGSSNNQRKTANRNKMAFFHHNNLSAAGHAKTRRSMQRRLVQDGSGLRNFRIDPYNYPRNHVDFYGEKHQTEALPA